MRSITAAVLALVALAPFCAAPVAAQALPSGTYGATCTGVRYVGSDLIGTCRSKNGQTYISGLKGASGCTLGVTNDDGQLRCQGKYPNGTYWKTCTGLRLTPDVLGAKCQRADGSWAGETTINDPWACAGYISNENGVLTCKGTRVRY